MSGGRCDGDQTGPGNRVTSGALIMEIIEQSSVSRLDRELINKQFSVLFGGQTDDVTVTLKPVPRAGRSGAMVRILDCEKAGVATRPYVAKFDARQRIELEWKRYQQCLMHFDVVVEQVWEPEPVRRRSILVAQHATGEKDDPELEVLLGNLRFPTSGIEGTLTLLFNERLKKLNDAKGRQPCRLFAHYRGSGLTDQLGLPLPNYLDREGTKLEDLRGWMGGAGGTEFFNTTLENLVVFAEEFGPFHVDTEVLMKNLHGDLHPRNVFVDRSGSPHLIDFGWAHRGHALKDYVLMEASLFLFALPRYKVPFPELAKAIRAALASYTAPSLHGFSGYLRRMLCLARVIRGNADQFCCWRNHEAEYWSALFLVVIGLIQIVECNTIAALFLAEQLRVKLRETQRGDADGFQAS